MHINDCVTVYCRQKKVGSNKSILEIVENWKLIPLLQNSDVIKFKATKFTDCSFVAKYYLHISIVMC